MTRKLFIMIAMCTVVSSGLEANQPELTADICGVAQSKTDLAVHGQDLTRGTFPWIVALMHIDNKTLNFFCGGTIISRTFVITGM